MILIALGANLNSPAGNPETTLRSALSALAAYGIEVLAVSSFYRTPAWPDPSDPPFVNAVARIETALPAADLLQTLHAIEAKFARTRSKPNAPRTLDLDLIDYRGKVADGIPVLPHPRAAERAFVLVPLAEIAPGWRHPASGRTVCDLLAALPLDAVEAVVPIAPRS